MRTRVRQGQAVIGVTLGHRVNYFSGHRGDGCSVVPTAERSSGSSARAAPCFCHNQITVLTASEEKRY